ncbi:major facilitator superfamily domain-containing protein [Multifurca ochricompacta]|uniref:Major facilitator superfamily domain-containing protein n=1 Tax=Multifurca ochricompacta TaxID=376703 RepID=A0AAD4QK17_9AGAM|nr:major facilitator superfamily domain-containing protein [Multifurca ochricompacta]
MAAAFHDTFFAYILRFALGSRVFPHPDEKVLPEVWHGKLSNQASPRDSAQATLNEAAANVDVTSIVSEATAIANNNNHVPKPDPEKGQDTLLVDWYGPTDPDNPLNWSSARKAWIMFQTCLLTFSVYLGSAIYTAGIPGVKSEFHVSTVSATVGLTAFVAGYGLGPMIFSPLSEVPQIGRMPIYIITLIFFVVLQVPTALATNYGMLMAFRFLTGFFGSPILATGGATISDLYIPKKRAYGVTLWGVFATCAPALGPLIGGFAAYFESWRWTIWELMWLSGAALVLLFFFYPETSASNILYRRAKRIRKATGNPSFKSASEIAAAAMKPRDLAISVLVRPFTLNFQEPIVFLLNVYIGLIYALLYIWFESFPIVFIGIYHWEEQLLGLSFLGIFIGAFVVMPPFFAYLYYVQEPKYNDKGELKPEERMPVAIFGALLVPISLFWFGWTSRASVHWIVPIIGSSFFSVAALLLFNTVLNYLADAYPLYAASVLAGNDFIRSMLALGSPSSQVLCIATSALAGPAPFSHFSPVRLCPFPFCCTSTASVSAWLAKTHATIMIRRDDGPACCCSLKAISRPRQPVFA